MHFFRAANKPHPWDDPDHPDFLEDARSALLPRKGESGVSMWAHENEVQRLNVVAALCARRDRLDRIDALHIAEALFKQSSVSVTPSRDNATFPCVADLHHEANTGKPAARHLVEIIKESLVAGDNRVVLDPRRNQKAVRALLEQQYRACGDIDLAPANPRIRTALEHTIMPTGSIQANSDPAPREE